jgi:hypothetical protein
MNIVYILEYSDGEDSMFINVYSSNSNAYEGAEEHINKMSAMFREHKHPMAINYHYTIRPYGVDKGHTDGAVTRFRLERDE